jgi:hypothetical protein
MNPYPLNRKALGHAVAGWLSNEQGPEADAQLVLALREIGMLSVADEGYFFGSHDQGVLHMYHPHGVVQVDTEGNVHIF